MYLLFKYEENVIVGLAMCLKYQKYSDADIIRSYVECLWPSNACVVECYTVTKSTLRSLLWVSNSDVGYTVPDTNVI